MTPLTKKLLLTFFIAGMLYAGFMTVIDYSNIQNFQWHKFITDALFSGGLITLLVLFNDKKPFQRKNENNNIQH